MLISPKFRCYEMHRPTSTRILPFLLCSYSYMLTRAPPVFPATTQERGAFLGKQHSNSTHRRGGKWRRKKGDEMNVQSLPPSAPLQLQLLLQRTANSLQEGRMTQLWVWEEELICLCIYWEAKLADCMRSFDLSRLRSWHFGGVASMNSEPRSTRSEQECEIGLNIMQVLREKCP